MLSLASCMTVCIPWLLSLSLLLCYWELIIAVCSHMAVVSIKRNHTSQVLSHGPIMLDGNNTTVIGFIITIFRENIGDKVSFMEAFPS